MSVFINYFSTDFWKIIHYENSMKNRPVGVELFNTDGQTDEWQAGGKAHMMKLTVPFPNFANAPRNVPVF